MSHVDWAIAGGVALAIAILLGTIVNRMVPPGSARRTVEDSALLLGCAAPGLAVFGYYLHHRLLAGVAIIAVAYGGFFLIRMRQLRRANRDGVRRLLGLDRDATFGEVMSQVEKIEPRPLTTTSRLVLGLVAAMVVVVGYQLDRFDTALIGLRSASPTPPPAPPSAAPWPPKSATSATEVPGTVIHPRPVVNNGAWHLHDLVHSRDRVAGVADELDD